MSALMLDSVGEGGHHEPKHTVATRLAVVGISLSEDELDQLATAYASLRCMPTVDPIHVRRRREAEASWRGHPEEIEPM